MNNNQVTMKQIADECGVSMMTVSRALSVRHRDKLRPETRERVLAAVKKYAFLSNPAASRLKRHKLDTITLLIGARALAVHTLNPDFDAHYEKISWGIVKDAVSTARKYGYDIKLEPILESCDEIIPHLDPRLTDGVLINSAYKHEPIIEHLQKIKMPYVIMASVETDIYKNTENHVIVDIEPGLRQAVEYLYNKGHRKIGFIGADLQTSRAFQEKIYEKLLHKKGVFNAKLFYSVHDAMGLRKLLVSFNGKFPFTALLCHNDAGADMAIKELRYMGIDVPGKIAVIGCDYNPTYQGAGSISLSTVELPRHDLVTQSVKLLIKTIDNESSDISCPVTIPARFIEGKTT